MTSPTADPERSRVEPTSTTPGGTWRAEAPTSGRPLGWDRCLLWGALVAAAAVVLFPAGGGAVVRLFGGAPSGLPLLAALGILVGLGAAAGARRGLRPWVTGASRLPEGLDGAWSRRPGRTLLVALIMVFGVVQLGRLSCFMGDRDLRWGSAYPPVDEGVEHMCMAAYLQAADLARQGDANIYAEHHYPVYGGDSPGLRAGAETRVKNLGPYIEDPYEYPPQFLLLPGLALALTDDYLVHRSGVFVVQVLAFLPLALIVAGWVGGPRGQLAGFLLPVMLGSMPLMFNFQFGQFHLAAIMLAMAGMLCFEGNRTRLGGGLLAVAIVTKVFPGLLVVYLLVRRRWSAVAATAGFSILISGLALAVLGAAPFVAFFEYHLPRIATGEAFAFFTKSDLDVATNYGVYGIPFKLQRLGVPGMSQGLAAGLAWVYGLVVVGVTVIAARRPRARAHEPLIWLGLLTLASLRSPLAPSVYVSAPAVWLLTLLAWDARGKAGRVVLLVLAWISMGGLPPLPTPEGTILLWMSGQVAILALGFWSVWRRHEAADARLQPVPHG